ncbi:lyase family protein [Bradyrhizobium sp. ISRA442]|uniref:hypothetical protein n=1 Tax=Bradyrhizobium sp. ISRA442 TaxID=2866197 RepID=UPI00311AE7B7
MGKTRREVDSLGEVDVPNEAYYGAQTVRAIGTFTISGISIEHSRTLFTPWRYFKKAVVPANEILGDIAADEAGAIGAACNAVIAGKLAAEFPINVFQGAAGAPPI